MTKTVVAKRAAGIVSRRSFIVGAGRYLVRVHVSTRSPTSPADRRPSAVRRHAPSSHLNRIVNRANKPPIFHDRTSIDQIYRIRVDLCPKKLTVSGNAIAGLTTATQAGLRSLLQRPRTPLVRTPVEQPEWVIPNMATAESRRSTCKARTRPVHVMWAGGVCCL